MKRLFLKLCLALAAVSTIVSLAGCERISLIERQQDPYSDSGENRVQAKFDRKFVKELWGYPDVGSMIFLVMTPLVEARLGAEEFYISAKLEDDNLSSIYFRIPVENLYEGATVTSPDIRVYYRGNPSGASEGELVIRKWDDQAGILSGTFSFKFEKHLKEGKKRTVDVTDGYFDVKLSKTVE